MYKKKEKGWIKHIDFIILDLLCLQLAFIFAYYFRHGMLVYNSNLYRNMSIFLLLMDIVVIYFNETYKNVLKRGYYKEFVSTVKHTALILGLSVIYLFSMKEAEDYSRIVLYITWFIYIGISYLTRNLWKCFLRKNISSQGKSSVILITSYDIVENTLKNFEKDVFGKRKVVGVILVDKDMTGDSIAGVPVVAGIKDVSDYVCHEWVDEVFIHINSEVSYQKQLVNKLVETGVTVHMSITDDYNIKGRKQLVEKIGNHIVLTTSINYMTEKEAILKRTLDILGGLIGCVLTGIIFVFIAPIIYISSPGPIFFSQKRVGQNGKVFKMYKFRSMYMDAEERKKELMGQNRIKDGLMFKVDFDTRIIGNKILPSGKKKTGIGNFIRRASLDEFPQFFNVLKGEMSLVGTRPPTLDEWEKYEAHHKARLSTKPGITGMWQVSGRSKITDFEKVVELDTKYINEWNIGLDIKILLKTVVQALKRDGSL